MKTKRVKIGSEMPEKSGDSYFALSHFGLYHLSFYRSRNDTSRNGTRRNRYRGTLQKVSLFVILVSASKHFFLASKLFFRLVGKILGFLKGPLRGQYNDQEKRPI